LEDAGNLLTQGLLSGIVFSKESVVVNELKKQFAKIQVEDVKMTPFYRPFKKVFEFASGIFCPKCSTEIKRDWLKSLRPI
jgi:hypothetical protein